MKKQSAGFLIVEVLLAIIILSMVFLSLFTTLSFLTNRTQRSTFDTSAASLMQDGMEQTRSALLARWNEYKEGNYYPDYNDSNNTWKLGKGDEGILQGRFTRTITISEVCRDLGKSGIQVECPLGQLDTQSKKITVKISWKEVNKDKESQATLLVYKQK